MEKKKIKKYVTLENITLDQEKKKNIIRELKTLSDKIKSIIKEYSFSKPSPVYTYGLSSKIKLKENNRKVLGAPSIEIDANCPSPMCKSYFNS